MAIYSLNIPYQNFEIGKVIDPSEFNANNGAIQTKVNEVINAVNNINIIDDDGNVVVPSYIKETFIDPVEIKSPLITGNTLIGSSGIVGMTSVGTSNDSVRFWAGSSNKDNAPFRVTHDGTVHMGKASIETVSVNGSKITIQNDYIRLQNNGTDKVTISNDNAIPTLRIYGDARYAFADSTSNVDITAHHVFYDNGKNFTAFLGHGFNDGDDVFDATYGNMMLFDDGFDAVRISGSRDKNSYIQGGLVLGGTATITNRKFFVYGDSQMNGNLYLNGDIYVNGVKMKLTPA